ncbi:hypothetical protein N7U66_06260 [Lacinutrix neustonica]|uniref:Uncharacterized protein n=1 Tax=Lacinutrix neustonica TaxID=2980107 RepID=A0A9E8MYF3_9FLAO|nr:hypothetical protein [Lacinutrix neustonica]WAC03189.1 hypothetical protein N7U66_06260 [Lacinutrix neustonica]
MKRIFSLLILGFNVLAYGQVAIGTSNIQNGVALQIESDSKGLLIPRVSLQAKNSESPITPSPIATGLMVYNIATSGNDSNAVIPGFYYWNGSLWVSLEDTTGTSDSWSLSGNAGTTPGTNYLGTSNNVDLQFKTNAVRRATIKNDGALILGNNNTPLSNTLTSVYPSGSQIGIYASSQNSPRTVRALNFSGTEFVIDGGNFDANGGRGVIGISTNMAANSTSTVTGVLGVSGTTSFSELQGESVGVSAQGTTGIHVRGVGKSTVDYYAGFFEYDQDNNTGTSTGPFARIAGKDYDYFTGGASRRDVTYGGYFDANTNSNDYVFVGARNNNTSYKVLGGGSVSTMVKDKEGNNRILHTTETPEILFEDFGIGELVNGEAYIEIDEVLSKNIYVNKNHPMKVFIQLEGDCNGVYVTNKSRKGFKVKELGDGKSNVSFSWNLVANRADALNADGSLSSKHVGVRLPIGPNKLELNKQTQKKYDIKK